MDDDCQWTATRLTHEIVSDLESLRGVWVVWDTCWPHTGNQYFLRVFAEDDTGNEKVFDISISMCERRETPGPIGLC